MALAAVQLEQFWEGEGGVSEKIILAI